MGGYKFLIAVFSAWLLLGLPSFVSAEEMLAAEVSQLASGRIVWMDTLRGRLDLKEGLSRQFGEYIIDKNDTRVTNLPDKKALSLVNLRSGQSVTVRFIKNEGENIADLITIEQKQ